MFCWLTTCAVSIFSVLDNFCQIAPLHSNVVLMTRVLHLICKAHTHTLLFGSKFHIILAIYLQMFDIYTEKIENIENIANIKKTDIFENIMIFPTLTKIQQLPTKTLAAIALVAWYPFWRFFAHCHGSGGDTFSSVLLEIRTALSAKFHVDQDVFLPGSVEKQTYNIP